MSVGDERFRGLNWGTIHALLLGCAALFLAQHAVTDGSLTWVGFVVLVLAMAAVACLTKFSVSPFESFFLFLSPVSVCVLTLVFYFYVVLAFNEDATEFCLQYVLWASAFVGVLMISLWPLAQRIELRQRAVYCASASSSLLLVSIVLGWGLLITAGIFGGVGSLWTIFTDPLQMRVFMSNSGMAYFKALCDFLVLMPPVIAALKRYSEGGSTAVFLVLIFSGLLYTVASGSRGATVQLVISLMIVRQFMGKPLNPLLVAGAAVLIVPFVAIAGVYRNDPALYGLGLANLLKVAGALGPERIAKLFVARLDSSFYFNLLTKQRTETPLLYGSSYLSWPLQIIPRPLWPSKPLLPNTALSYQLVTSPASNATFDFSIFGESYLNFGLSGFFFCAVTIVGLVAYMQRRYLRMVESREVSEVLLFSMLWAIPMYAIVGGIIAAATTGIMTFLQYLAARALFLREANLNEPIR